MSLKRVSLKQVSLKEFGLKVLLASCLMVGLSACSGDTDGGKAGDENFEGSQFQPDDENSGRLVVELVEDEIAVSETTGFFARVTDSNGAPVPQIRVNCDSEAGVAIIEPSLGAEHTDSSGQISGRIGCALPGSFQFACRLPGGGNRRTFVDVKCTGDIPAGFDGFPGAAGGTLGGGSGGVQNTGGENAQDARILTITAVELGSETVQVDAVRGICINDPADATDNTDEPFSDGFLRVGIVNNSSSLVELTSISYVIPNYDGTGRSFSSSQLAIVGEATASADGGEAQITSLAFSANSGTKEFVNFSSGNKTISSSLGFRNVKVTVRGINSLGETVEATGSITISFSGYDRCSD